MPDEPMDRPPRAFNTEDLDEIKPQELPKRRSVLRRNWGKLTLLTLVGGPILVLSLWTAIALAWSYSTGDRVGYVQKFSRKGWLCKTWEGELAMVSMPGTAAQIFPFTVRDDAVAAKVNAAAGKKVAITYEQHVGMPTSCFGETQHFVTGVRTLE